MKIAICNLPLKTAHKTRGIGFYTSRLIGALKHETDIEICEFSKLSDIKDADIIHYPWFDLFFHTLPIFKRFPTVVTVHDVIPLLFPKYYPVGLKGRINFIMQKMALQNCKYIITDSMASKKDITRYLKVEDKKITVIPLAADQKFQVVKNDNKLIFIRKKYRLPDRFLLYVGDANRTKNVPFLIEGFRKLINSPGFADLKLVLIGNAFLKNVENIDHPELISLKSVNKLIKQYKLEGNIIRPGQLSDEDLVYFYNLATLYVQPSVYEGFGLPVLEAFACGTPVITANKGSLPEVGGQAAVYFDPDNIGQFTSIVKEIIENTSLRNKLSKLGLQRSAQFSWKKVAEETKLVYFKAEKDE